MPELLKFTVQSFTADQLEIKVKNTSGTLLDKTLSIELYPPSYLVSTRINEIADEAAKSEDPQGSKTLKPVVTGPDGWSVWARSESVGSSFIIVFINDMDESAKIVTPAKLPVDAEFIIRIPLNPENNRATVNLLYSYLYGTNPDSVAITGSLELKPEKIDWTPNVTLTTDYQSPTAVTPPGTFVNIKWAIENGVSATLRGPLPGGNTELTLSDDAKADFKISSGSLSVAVASSMTYLLQAEVKHPQGKPNVQVVRMLWLDTANKKHVFVSPRPTTVLPYGLIEIDWAAWGVKDVRINVSGRITRNIPLTQQTLGRFFEGSGVMRVSATHTVNDVRTTSEAIQISSGTDVKKKDVQVVSWVSMERPVFKGVLLGLAVNAPKIGLLTTDGLYVAQVGNADPSTLPQKLPLTLKTPEPNVQFYALTVASKKFVCLQRPLNSPDLEVAPYTVEGVKDTILPLTLPADIRALTLSPKAVFDFVGLGNRVFFVVEIPLTGGAARRAYSVGFDANKADLRSEPLLERLIGYRLFAFDGALYALSPETGQMLRFGVTEGKLEKPRKAAPATRKRNTQEESMVSTGLIMPLGRNLIVLSPASVPSIESLERYGLKNTLSYEQTDSDADNLPQDLFYNPQKDYWGRCGHDLNIKKGAKAAYRAGASPRLWVVQPDGEQYTLHTLSVGTEDLFVHDYMPEYPPKPLPPPVAKTRMFTIECNPIRVMPIEEKYRSKGFVEFSTPDPAVPAPRLPMDDRNLFQFDLTYDENNPAPVKIVHQVKRDPFGRRDIDYLLEVTLSGPDLSTATSCYRRLNSTTQFQLGNDEIDGSRTTHSTYGYIQVPRPARMTNRFRLAIVNTSKTLPIKMTGWNNYEIRDKQEVPIDADTPDFLLGYLGKEGGIQVRLNFALPHGIESSGMSNPAQTKLLLLKTIAAERVQLKLSRMLAPGEAALNIEGMKIESTPDRPVYVVQLDYRQF